MGQALLTASQREVLALVAREPNLAHVYLTGGTALAAYYLYHRRSDDLDFFSRQVTDPVFLHDFMEQVRKRLKAQKVHFSRIYDRQQFLVPMGKRELKVEFVHYQFPQLSEPILRGGVRIDSLRDIAANKIMAILDRFEPKDFVDLYYLLQRFQLRKVRKDVARKFRTSVDPIVLGSAFANVRRIEALPKMRKHLTRTHLKEFFEQRAKELAPMVLRE